MIYRQTLVGNTTMKTYLEEIPKIKVDNNRIFLFYQCLHFFYYRIRYLIEIFSEGDIFQIMRRKIVAVSSFKSLIFHYWIKHEWSFEVLERHYHLHFQTYSPFQLNISISPSPHYLHFLKLCTPLLRGKEYRL